MSMQDPIADMLTRIRNAQLAGETQICFPASNIKAAMLNVLKEEGYIEDFKKQNSEGKNTLEVSLKYYQGEPVIRKIERVSKLSLRVYKGSRDLPTVKGGMGIAIVSTPKGVMTERAAREKNVGGEVLCTVE